MRDKQKELAELVREKDEAVRANIKMDKKIKQLVQEHQELQALVEDYQDKYNDLQNELIHQRQKYMDKLDEMSLKLAANKILQKDDTKQILSNNNKQVQQISHPLRKLDD